MLTTTLKIFLKDENFQRKIFKCFLNSKNFPHLSKVMDKLWKTPKPLFVLALPEGYSNFINDYHLDEHVGPNHNFYIN